MLIQENKYALFHVDHFGLFWRIQFYIVWRYDDQSNSINSINTCIDIGIY